MNEKEFENGHREVLEALRAARGDCPEPEALLDWAEGALPTEEAEAIERHVTLCSACADALQRAAQPDPQIDDLSWRRTARRLDARAGSWQPSKPRRQAAWLAAAAAAVAAVAVVLVYLPEDGARSPAAISETRSADITLLEPRGPVDALEAFRWQGIPAPVEYRVEVRAIGAAPEASDPLWAQVTSDTRLQADPALRAALEAQPLQWRVVVLDDEGYVLASSAWVRFELAP